MSPVGGLICGASGTFLRTAAATVEKIGRSKGREGVIVRWSASYSCYLLAFYSASSSSLPVLTDDQNGRR